MGSDNRERKREVTLYCSPSVTPYDDPYRDDNGTTCRYCGITLLPGVLRVCCQSEEYGHDDE